MFMSVSLLSKVRRRKPRVIIAFREESGVVHERRKGGHC